MKLKKFNLITKILFHVTLFLYGLMAVAGPILLANSTIVNGYLGIKTQGGNRGNGSTYFDTKYDTMEQVRNASLELIEETMAEGAVLLKNENGALPLDKGDSVTLYGIASYYSAHTGQGSSGSETGTAALSDRVTFYDGLTGAGLNVNSALNEWYGNQSIASYLGNSNFMGSASQETQYVVKDIEWSALPDSKNNNAKSAIMVIARNSGEAVDMYMDTTMDDGQTRVIVSKQNNNKVSGSVGDSLELTSAEKSVLQGLKQLKSGGAIENIVVIMNSASPLQCEFVDNDSYGIDACLWVGTIGTNGATAIGKLLTGEYNPSGRTADTFWANSKYNPVYYNFGSMEYGDSGKLKNYFATLGDYNNKYYIAYQEGIYNGYKYTETRYEDVLTNRPYAGDFDYNKVVTYPFGYGLSYTEFEYTKMSVTRNGGKRTYNVSVEVKNIGDVNGKEVVQVYLQKPYTSQDIKNGVEKASVELIGYAKTDVIEPGKTATVNITVKEKYFAAYDANVENTYVIGSSDRNDKYLLTAAKDAHDAVNNILQYKSKNNVCTVNTADIVNSTARGKGEANLVWDTYIAYDTKTYSTNDFIDDENKLDPAYDGAEVNYGVDKITNQFEDSDFTKSDLFSSEERNQQYLTRNDWEGTYGKRIILTASDALAEAQKAPAVTQNADVEYPTYNATDKFYITDEIFDELKLIYLRGRDYNDPLWNDLLDKMSYEETCVFLQNGLRVTNSVPSIAAPATSQQNGALAPVHSHEWGELIKQSDYQGFVMQKDPANKGKLPPVFVCNGIVASSYNTDLALRLGEQQGEEAAWAGYHGMYGLGVNIHRGAYCGRTFEYYSEDGYLTGVAAGYQTVGYHKLGVFVLLKHAVLNDQETHRAGLNVWANEQTIREIYCRAMEIAIEIDREMTPTTVIGVMTGMNRLGAKWTGGQGFCNTVLKAEFGMRGYVVSDYNSSRLYMSPIQGVLNGNDLPDGQTSGWAGGRDYDGNNIKFEDYAPEKGNYGELAWAMRESAHTILYTVVNSIAMNGVDGDSSFNPVTPAWQIAVPVVTRVMLALFIWSTVAFAVSIAAGFIGDYMKKKQPTAGTDSPQSEDMPQSSDGDGENG